MLAAVLCCGCGAILEVDDLMADRVPGPSNPPSGIEVTTSAGTFRIDALPVTVSAYGEFIDAGLLLADQASNCSWNDSFVPGQDSQVAIDWAAMANEQPDPQCIGYLDRRTSEPELPAACIDVCDMRAYCVWAGMHLCGRIGGGILDATDFVQPANSTESAWYRACSKDGTQAFPYGDTYEMGRCNDDGSGVDDVGKFDTCQGGYDGLFDMSGNLFELVDECTDYNNPDYGQNCLSRGGAYFSDEAELRCDNHRDVLLSLPSSSFGFRCCAG